MRASYPAPVLFDAIFLTLFFLTWILLGGLPWLALSLRRRAEGALWALPFALLGGAGGGVILPLLGLDDGVGVGVSMIGAAIGGGALAASAFCAWDACALGARFARWEVRPDPPPQPLPPGLPGPAPGEHPLPAIDSDPDPSSDGEHE